jgi:dienelactone hydrolase
MTGEQSGKAELIFLHEHRGTRITGEEEWKAHCQSIKRVISAFSGAPPATKPPPAPKLLNEISFDTHVLRELTFQSEPGEHVPAYLLIPKTLHGPTPAVLCPHQTTHAGKKEPAGLAGNPQLYTALDLVRRGYITLTWDALCFGERHNRASGHYGDAIRFYRKHPRWSLMGKMAWDTSRAIDYLQTLEFVDPSRIGCIGHSHGGYTTLWAMAFDERIRAGVSNCGFDTFRLDGNTWRWSHATALLPRLGFYISSPHIKMDRYRAVPDSDVINVPFDMHQLLALITPRPLFLSTSDEDFVFPNGGWSARLTLRRLEPVYQIFDANDRLSGHFFREGHSFPAEAARKAYEWLDRWLKV